MLETLKAKIMILMGNMPQFSSKLVQKLTFAKAAKVQSLSVT